MTNTEEEELRKVFDSFDNTDRAGINSKMNTVMLQIVKMDNPANGFTIFKDIFQRFSKEELAMIACIYVGKEMVKKLETDPEFKGLCQMLKHLDNTGKKHKEKE